MRTVRGASPANPMTRLRRPAAAAAMAVAVLAAACSSPQPSGSLPASATASGSGVAAGSPSANPSPAATIPQPSVTGIDVADPSQRVDVEMPVFSTPTNITNPLFPILFDSSNLYVGTVEDKAFRTEVTVLPQTRIVDWNGQQVETVVSQYNAFLDGRIEEIAYDLYAQADDGSVWYFGEDVFNFADGAIADTHGTWLAGIDGPAAMIMPANPQVGDVYRPENIPGLVFEEVIVQQVDQTLDGPFGPVSGGIVVEEHHADGGSETKQFATAYGEFYTAAGGEVEALALAVPTDAAAGGAPASLDDLDAAVNDAVQAALDRDMAAVRQSAADAEAARADLGVDVVPVLLQPLLRESVADLAAADNPSAAANAAIQVARLAGDLRLRYEPVAAIDLARFGLWGAQLVVDARAERMEDVLSDNFALSYVRDRLTTALAGQDRTQLDTALEDLQVAIDDEDFGAMADSGMTIWEFAAETAIQ
jgi:hypothetical protein